MIEREAIHTSKIDNNVPRQYWLDTLRETDDGGFSSSTVRPSMDYYQKKKSIVLNELSRKLKISSYKRN